MPQLRSKQILGDDPIAPKDLTTKEYVDIENVNNRLTVIDDDHTVTGVTAINFIGVDITPSPTNNTIVDVWIPRPIYVDNFNENDSVLANYTISERYIATPSTGALYDIGDWIGGTVHNALPKINNHLGYSTSDFFAIYRYSTFESIMYSADGITELAKNTIILDGNTTHVENSITVIVSDWTTDSDKFKAKIMVSFNVSSILPNGGRFSVSLIHHNGANEYEFNSTDIFSDDENLIANIGGSLELTEGTTRIVKSLSGVDFYTIGTTWDIYIDSINNLNSNTYPVENQMIITHENVSFTDDLFVVGTGFTGWSDLDNASGFIYQKTNIVTNIINVCNWDNQIGNIQDTNIIASVYDWGNIAVDSISSVNYNYLIDTFEQSSTFRKIEEFRTEDNATYPRLNSSLLTWDNTESLITIDSGNGLQVICDRLVYPEFDFTAFITDTITQPDYTGLTGDRYYYRKFETNGASVSNGIIIFDEHNITEADLLNGDVNFEITVDGGITWFTLNEQYSPLSIGDGTGARVDRLEYGLGITGSTIMNDSSLKYTLQGVTTKQIHLKITFTTVARDNNKYIGSIEFTSGNWDNV